MRYFILITVFFLLAIQYACNKWDLDKGNENHSPIFTIESISDTDTSLIIYLDFKDLGYKNKLSDCGIIFTNKGEPTSLSDSIRSLGGKEKNGRDSIVLPLDFNHIFYNIKAYAVNNDSLYLSAPNYIEPRRKWDAVFIDTSYVYDISYDHIYLRFFVNQYQRINYYEKGFIIDTSSNFATARRKEIEFGFFQDVIGRIYFQDSISGLRNNQKYYVKTFIKDKYWTQYSDVDSFITDIGLPSFLFTNYRKIQLHKNVILEAQCMLGSENVEISKVGFQVSTLLSSLDNEEIIESSLDESNQMSITLTDLQSEQQYYVRAVLITDHGDVYSDTLNFTIN